MAPTLTAQSLNVLAEDRAAFFHGRGPVSHPFAIYS